MIENMDLETTTEATNVVSNELVSQNPVTERVQALPLSALDSAPPQRKPGLPMNGVSLPLEAMLDVPITLIFEVGRTDISIKQLMELGKGSYVELRNVSVDSIDVRVNEQIIAQAETIAMPQRYGIRFGEVEMIRNTEEADV